MIPFKLHQSTLHYIFLRFRTFCIFSPLRKKHLFSCGQYVDPAPPPPLLPSPSSLSFFFFFFFPLLKKKKENFWGGGGGGYIFPPPPSLLNMPQKTMSTPGRVRLLGRARKLRSKSASYNAQVHTQNKRKLVLNYLKLGICQID